MKPLFIECSVKSFPIGGQVSYDHVNPPININIVTHITTDEPQLYGGARYPQIHFEFIGGSKATWRYRCDTKDVPAKREVWDRNPNPYRTERVPDTTKRDADYDRIMKMFGENDDTKSQN